MDNNSPQDIVFISITAAKEGDIAKIKLCLEIAEDQFSAREVQTMFEKTLLSAAESQQTALLKTLLTNSPIQISRTCVAELIALAYKNNDSSTIDVFKELAEIGININRKTLTFSYDEKRIQPNIEEGHNTLNMPDKIFTRKITSPFC